MPFSRSVYYAFLHFYHMDKANAAVHMAEVKFSPITFALWEQASMEAEVYGPELDEVDKHLGKYELDKGR
jgi:hypothetical protein